MHHRFAAQSTSASNGCQIPSVVLQATQSPLAFCQTDFRLLLLFDKRMHGEPQSLLFVNCLLIVLRCRAPITGCVYLRDPGFFWPPPYRESHSPTALLAGSFRWFFQDVFAIVRASSSDACPSFSPSFKSPVAASSGSKPFQSILHCF